MENYFRKLEPYMLYGDRSIQGNSMEKTEAAARDLEYLQGMYPLPIKRLQEYVISACDHLDYRNSPIYDEFPDRMMINRMCDSICGQLREDGVITEEPPPLMETMEKKKEEKMEWGEEDTECDGLSAQQRGGGRRPPDFWPPDDWGRGPSGHRPPKWSPPGHRPPSGHRPPPGCPPSGPCPPRWDSAGPGRGWLDGIVSVLLLNEMHRRRCRSGLCW